MTNEEAIKVLKKYKKWANDFIWEDKHVGRHLDEYNELLNAIDTATDALKADTQTEDYTTPEDKYSKEDIDNAVDMIHDYCVAHHDTCNCCYLAHSIFCDVKNPESWRRFSGEEL